MSNISAKPNPRYRFLFFKSLQKNYFFKEFIFFNTGREALLYGLKKLKLDQKKTILIPGYICYSLVEPIIQKGYKVEYYDVNKNLSVDLKYLETTVKTNSNNNDSDDRRVEVYLFSK